MLRLLRSVNGDPISSLAIGLTRRWLSSCKSTVMSFGDGNYGALGLPASIMGMGNDAYEPTPIPGLPSDISIIAAGHYHSLAVTSSGDVWAWGRNNEGQLGRDPLSTRDTWNEPKKVKGLNKVGARSAFASGVISAAVGKDGSLWVWGRSKRGQLGLGAGVVEALLPTKVETLLEEDIVKVSLGWGHALALTAEGKLFGWGYYADGRLGKIGKTWEASPLEFSGVKSELGYRISGSVFEEAEKLVSEAMDKEKNMPIIWEPTVIEELHGVKVTDISCGLDHSLILCSNGTLLSGGSNIYGQLGRVNSNLGLHPVDISFQPSYIASGLGHSLAICSLPFPQEDAANIFSWGWNQSSQLGREGPENSPLVIEELAGERPIAVSAGRAHSLAVTAKREVWAWGSGRNGRLGLGSSSNEGEPVLVGCLEGFQVLQAVAGFDHSLVLVTE